MAAAASLVPLLLLIALFFFSSSSPVASQQSDSCAANLAASQHIAFNTSSLSCLTALGSANFVLRYGNAGPGLWSFVLSAPDPGSYIAVGFSTDGEMVGSSAVAGWLTGSGPGTVKQYKLDGKKSSKCPPDQGSLQLGKGNSSTIVSLSSRLYMAFQLSVDQPPPYLIFAVGPKNSLPSTTNYLPEHQREATVPVNYTASAVTTATSSGAEGGSEGGGDDDDEEEESEFGTERKHALLVMLGWGVLMPVGIALARFFKGFDPFWFYAHITVQGIGFALGLAGVIVGFGLDDEGIDGIDTHKGLGIAILVGGCLQVTALLARPDKTSKVRKYWNWYHHYIGRAAIIIAIANIFYGFHIAEETNSWNIGYGIFLGVWALVCVFLEIKRCMTREDDDI